ncbi:hypothetical protein DV737_g5791, partial [Chaetothyriales sp. CBS 132003]
MSAANRGRAGATRKRARDDEDTLLSSSPPPPAHGNFGIPSSPPLMPAG